MELMELTICGLAGDVICVVSGCLEKVSDLKVWVRRKKGVDIYFSMYIYIIYMYIYIYINCGHTLHMGEYLGTELLGYSPSSTHF